MSMVSDEPSGSAEITGRKGNMQINPDGTKTMETGGEKMIYQWNADLNIITKQTEESNNVGVGVIGVIGAVGLLQYFDFIC
jgi:hypothetical protein